MLVTDIFEEIHENFANREVQLPSLPDIAMRIHKAARDPNCNFDSIGKVIKSDTALSAHLIRMANSPLYLTRRPVTNVRAAVHRIGVPGVRSFATQFALSNLFHSYNHGLNKLFRDVWEDSCEISALTAVLATFCAGFDPDDALLAGLLQDIGIVVLLGQVAQHGEDITDADNLHTSLDRWGPSTGVMLLESWEFDPRYIEVVRSRHDWHRDGSDQAGLADVVTLARLHRYAVSGRMADCPPINEVPAFRKLPVGQLSPQMSLQILEEAREEIGAIRAMLRG
ncbi:MAG: HDOD domain-containing protein [Gammaproteobacteria bacterium]|nr:HDOD domain-containing protein [Gammaproteobacteria bacterium]NNM20009.1 HDOD domain-containing protein [Gammaproteobacteria bacterium]